MDYASKFVVGTGAALNVVLGFIPDYVKIVNVSDRDAIFEGSLAQVLAFTSGGTEELKGGQIIVQSDALGTWAQVKEVLVHTGTWAAGNAAGYIVLEPGVGAGTFAASKTIAVAPARQNPLMPPGGATGNYATTGATPYVANAMAIGAVTSSKAVNAAAANQTIAAYRGTIANAPTLGIEKGVTLGAGISEDNKLLHVAGWREAAN